MVRITESKKYTLIMNGASGNLSDEFEFDNVADAVKYASRCDLYNYYFISDENGNVIKRGRCNTVKESKRNTRRRSIREQYYAPFNDDVDYTFYLDEFKNFEKALSNSERKLKDFSRDAKYLKTSENFNEYEDEYYHIADRVRELIAIMSEYAEKM